MARRSKSKSGPAEGSAESRSAEAHKDPHAFKRVSGPGPNDAGKGAAGAEAQERLEGGPERVSEGEHEDDDEGGATDRRHEHERINGQGDGRS
jgi:hypothetical protein